MLSEGRISVDEADELLAALQSGASAGAARGVGGQSRSADERWGGIEFDIDGLGERIHQTVMRGLERVERELRDLDLRMRREDWPRHWKMGGRARATRTWTQTTEEERSDSQPKDDAQGPGSPS
jgi:hypothetical protein